MVVGTRAISNGMKKILIIEDEAALREVLADTVKQGGFMAIEAADGEEGLSVALSEHPDLILLDILMPKIDGVTVLKKLREDKWGKSVPVIMLTNVDDDKHVEEIVKHGASYYFIKTKISLVDVVSKIQDLLRE